ncbi:MAG TPA: hypothetical protein VGI64_12465 [Streptosporangiaceae bacterium]|jgi:hypothetical protein
MNLTGSTLFFILMPIFVPLALFTFIFAPLLADHFTERQDRNAARALAESAKSALVDRTDPVQVPPQAAPSVPQPPRPRSGADPSQTDTGQEAERQQAEQGSAGSAAAGDRPPGRPRER